MTKFAFKWEAFKLTAERLVFTGELDRTIDWDNDPVMKELRDQVRSKSSNKTIIIDLSTFGTWDTEGIEEIIEKLLEPLVTRGKAKIGIAAPRYFQDPKTGKSEMTQIYEDAKLKQAIVDTDELPWEDNPEATFARLLKQQR